MSTFRKMMIIRAVAFFLVTFGFPWVLLAGNLDSPGLPDADASNSTF